MSRGIRNVTFDLDLKEVYIAVGREKTHRENVK